MKHDSEDCRTLREALLDRALAGRSGELPPSLEKHLSDCGGCGRYQEGLQLAPRLYEGAMGVEAGEAPGPLCTPALRRRTSDALDKSRRHPPWLGPLLFPASAGSVAASFIGPVWILSRLFQPIVGSDWLSLTLAFAMFSSVGVATLGAGLVALHQRWKADSHWEAHPDTLQEVRNE